MQNKSKNFYFINSCNWKNISQDSKWMRSSGLKLAMASYMRIEIIRTPWTQGIIVSTGAQKDDRNFVGCIFLCILMVQSPSRTLTPTNKTATLTIQCHLLSIVIEWSPIWFTRPEPHWLRFMTFTGTSVPGKSPALNVLGRRAYMEMLRNYLTKFQMLRRNFPMLTEIKKSLRSRIPL